MAKRKHVVAVELSRPTLKPPSDMELASVLVAHLHHADSWDREKALKLAALYFGLSITRLS